jgi:diguanylate cyclase (GGDEF)-like protein
MPSSTVLAIDDSPEMLALLRVRLVHEGVTLLTAEHAESGLALAIEAQPDLILLDIDLPEESGLDLCRRLKSIPETAHIPIIFLTATNAIETKVHGFDLGAVDFVTKPFHPAELRARVRAALKMKRAQDMLTREARVDALTGLKNRAFFDERLIIELEAARRKRTPLSLVMIDLDHFKKLNDNHGHPFGDLVLQRVGELLSQGGRRGDAACRYGGEELALLLAATDLEGAVNVAERTAERIRALELPARNGARVVITASFGVAEASRVQERNGVVTAPMLLSAADEALYAAKQEGRDRVHAWTGTRRESLLRLAHAS